MPAAEFHNTGTEHTRLPEYTKTIFLPYTKPFTSIKCAPMVRMTIEGAEIDMPVDTGSTGVLIGAPLVPHLKEAKGEPVYQYFTSSRILYTGRLITLSVTFHDFGNSSAVAIVPVFVVDKSVICTWYDPNRDTFDCPKSPDGREPTPRNTARITYMGVGFGRNHPGSGMPAAIPKRNPFLNICSINSERLRPGMHRVGYTMSTEGIHIGLTAENTRGFHFTKLQPGVTHSEDKHDWAMARMEFSVNGEKCESGFGLIDTGISQMYIRADEDFPIPTRREIIPDPRGSGKEKEVERVKPGTVITIGFPSLGEEIAGYSFAVGVRSAMEPNYVAPGKQTPPPFVNTGRNFLHGYSIAFDADGGAFGFRRVRSSDRQ